MNYLEYTVEPMLSDDWKERFRAEYHQTKERYERLIKALTDFDLGKLEYDTRCPVLVLRKQAKAMNDYIICLETRAQWEGINLEFS